MLEFNLLPLIMVCAGCMTSDQIILDLHQYLVLNKMVGSVTYIGQKPTSRDRTLLVISREDSTDDEEGHEDELNGMQSPMLIIDDWLSLRVPVNAATPMALLRHRIAACFAAKVPKFPLRARCR